MQHTSTTSGGSRPRAIIFGAGTAGQSAFANLGQKYRLIAFADNNSAALPNRIEGLPVLAPKDLSTLSFDKVLIASEYAEQIYQQLTEVAGISDELIEVVSATDMKSVHFGDTPSTRQIAERMLGGVVAQFEESDMTYYVDAGTLLGIHRDGELIPWDDDLDFAVISDDLRRIDKVLPDVLAVLQEMTSVPWQAHRYFAERSFGAVKQGDVRSLKLAPKDPDRALPLIDIFVKYVDGNWMDYVLSSRGIRMPSHHILNTCTTDFKGYRLRIPGQIDEYLTRHYGDWHTPKRDWDLGDIKSATVFQQESRP